MASIFNKTNSLYENPKRNTMNVSRQNNLTFNFGQLIPCAVQEVLPGDTVSIDTTMGLKSLPFIFPVQTRMRAHIHHFYVRNRTLWKDWQDFITMSKDNLVPPYISPNKSIGTFYETGKLSDYLGIPTTYYGPSEIFLQQKVITAKKQNLRVVDNIISYNIGDDVNTTFPTIIFDDRLKNIVDRISTFDYASLHADIRASWLNKQDTFSFVENLMQSKSRFPNIQNNLVPTDKELVSVLSNEFRFTLTSDMTPSTEISCCIYCDGLIYNKNRTTDRIYLINNNTSDYLNPFDGEGNLFSLRFTDGYVKYLYQYYPYILVSDIIDDVENHGDIVDVIQFFKSRIDNFISTGTSSIYNDGSVLDYYFVNQNVDITIANSISGVDRVLDGNDINNPYGDAIRVSALPFRAYEMIYNSFYRDSRNNPRYVNGQPEYNKFLTTDEGGEDDTAYRIFNRNWEQDFLTTSVQSPQQGVAPLVGVTSLGEFQFRDEDGHIYTAQAQYASDGDTIESFKINSPDMPVGNMRQLVDVATYGISISDFRNVNALQRWLEINMRRGIRYQDQIKSHYGVDVKYKDYAYPEFLGGHSEEIYINQINQTTPTDGSPLGSFAGQGGTFGSSKHKIQKYCDEHGFIISIVSVVPVANYSQLLPKYFLKDKPLDYFFPEFGHLGMQPITYKEVCPLQVWNQPGIDDRESKLNETFGYQRAWYDYLSATDEVHGLFRTNLKNFVVHRKFANIPELSPDFLTVNHEDIDDVFAVTDNDSSHKIMGQIYFNYLIKRPIPMYGIPKLEV